MIVADNIIKRKIQNVYFIWGRGKTTIANELNRRYGYFIYDVDKARERHYRNADPVYQPYMCRDYEKEYNVSDFWELPPEVIEDRENHWLNEFTPMAIIDLIELSSIHDVILCEGDLESQTVLPVAIISHIVYLSNQGTKFDWFNRPDHSNSLDSVKNRVDLTEAEKDEIIRNAYNSVAQSESKIPGWVIENNIKVITWNDNTTIDQTTTETSRYFNFI